MDRRATLAKCLVHLLTALAMASATGCTMIGYAIGSTGDSPAGSRPGPSTSRAVLTETAGAEEEWNWGPSGHVSIQGPPRRRLAEVDVHDGRGGGVPWGATGALIGAVIDVAVIVAAAFYLPTVDLGFGGSESDSYSPPTCGGSGDWC